jgi:TonB-dependent starch-binding outer membrane protein SusC
MKPIKFLYQLLFVFLLLGISGAAFGQTRTVTGTVSDNNGEAMPGVAVVIQGSTTGVVTDINGHYSISVPSAESVLTFSFIGYVKEQATVGNQQSVNVTLNPTVQNLDEIVVVGYGTAKKKDVTSSMVTVKGDNLKQETQGNVTTALQGKAAGVQVIGNGGAPGSAPTVLIRGFTSINCSNSPLYVVDGIPIVTASGDNGDINFISTDEIENLEVLKDASAAAIYGTRASAGVIIVTTKRGKEGKTKYDFSLSYGNQVFNKPYNTLNSQQYAKAVNLAYENSGLSDLFTDTESLNYTDWWKAGIRKNSPEMNASFNMSGGTEKHQFNVGLTYFKQESFYHEGQWERFTLRVNNDLELNKWIKVGIDLNPRREYWDNTPDWYGDYLKMDPITPIYKTDDQLTGSENEYSKYARSLYTEVWNPVARDSRQKGNNGGYYGLFANSYIDIHPIKNLVFKSQIGATVLSTTYNTFNPEYTIDAAYEYNALTDISRKKISDFNWSWQNTLTYNLTVGKHSGSAMIGMTAEKQNEDYVKGERTGYPNTSEAMREIDGSNGTVQYASGNTTESSIVSYIGRLTYNYDSKYLLSGTVRRDGSSKFMDANKYAFFPSVSGAWRFSNEEFLKNISVISDAKLFAGWGTVGNQAIPNAVYLSTLGTDYYVFGSGTGSVSSVTTMSTMRNQDIKWETVEEKNAGLDVKLFNSALSATVEVFQKTTHDMLFQKTYPYYSGFPDWGNIWTNIGKMESKGVDVALNYHHENKKLRLDFGLTLSHADVKMKELSGTSEMFGGDTWNSTYPTRTVVGDVPGYFYGYKTDGIFQNEYDINSHTSESGDILQSYARPGDIRFVDTNKDGVLNSSDRVKLGSPYPDLTGGFNFNGAYKTDVGDFDLGLNVYFSYGNKIINYLLYDKYNAVGRTNLASDALDKAWHGEGTSNKIPILSYKDLNENYTKFSDLYLEDGSYIRLKNIQLGYSLPKSIVSKLNISNLRFYISGQNLLTLTKFTGIDPEANFSVLNYGFARFNYPVMKTYFIGVNMSF